MSQAFILLIFVPHSLQKIHQTDFCYHNLATLQIVRIHTYYKTQNQQLDQPHFSHSKSSKSNYLAINWSSFIKITSEINNYIQRCGDIKSEYRVISNWRVLERGLDLLLDPYFFSKQALFTVIKLTNEYLQKLN